MKESEIRPDRLLGDQAVRLANDIKRLLRHKESFVLVPCPACGSAQFTNTYEKYSIQFVRCLNCETVYANPRPTPNHLDEYYQESENYAYWNAYIFPASAEARREKIFKPRVQQVINICRKFNIETDTLLEVGAGFGLFCEEVQKTGVFRQVIGIEPMPDLARTCRARGLHIIEQPIEQVVLENEKINVIANFEVIEHLFSPKEFLMKCYQLLSPGGIFVVTCPNVKGFDILTLAEKSNSVDNEHINLFHLDSLARLLTSCGFEIVERQTPGRLDAELVRKKILSGELDVAQQPFLKQILIDEWEVKGEAFQNFLSTNNLSSNMLIVARKIAD